MATLSDQHKLCLEGFIGKKLDFQLLYKGSRDGCVSTTFHSKCDNQGPTVTVLYNTNNTVFGGYTSVNWDSSGSYKQDNNAFLFRLQYNGAHSPIKYSIKSGNVGNAIYCQSNYGPTFGGGHDLHCFSGNINHNGSCYPLNGNTNGITSYAGHTYDNQGHDATQFCNGSLQVKDIEVYSVKDAPVPAQVTKSPPTTTTTSELLKKPWRKFTEWNSKTLDKLTESVTCYKPYEEMDIPEARILLIGQVGGGKSSFYNTISSIFRGRISNKAASGSVMKSLTTMFRIYDVQQTSSRDRMNFRLCDTRGLEQEQGLAGDELSFLLDGNIPDRYQFNPAVPFSPEVSGFIQSPKIHEKMHCVAFVMDASSVDVMPEKTLEKIKEIQSRIYQRGMGQVVLLTKIDKLCPYVSDDVSTVFHSSEVRDAVDKISQTMGLPRSSILPVKNYENEVMLDDNIGILALQALLQILNFADDYISNLYDRMKSEQPQRFDSNTSEKMRHLNVKE